MKKALPYFFYFSIITLTGIFVLSCNEGPSLEPEDRGNVFIDSLQVDTLPVLAVAPPPFYIKYHIDSLVTAGQLDSVMSRYNEGQLKIVYALNRIEDVRVGVGKSLVVPDTIFNDLLEYSPFPRKMKLLDTIPKTVIISQRIQAFALYEEDSLVKWGPVSSGKLSTPTPNGLHYGNFKAKRKISTVNKDWILPYYFNFMNFEGVGVHQYLLPGFPASHACVRLYMEDAEYIYNWAKQWKLDPTGNHVVRNGTPFMVFGDFDYEEEYPWFALAKNYDCNDLTDAELKVLENYVQEYLMDSRNFDEEKNLQLQQPLSNELAVAKAQ